MTFARVAYFRADYAPESLGALTNHLGSERDGILLPRSLAQGLQLAEGSRVRLNVLVDEELRMAYDFRVVGSFDYYPTMFPDAPVVVANLEYLQSQGDGILPYGIWMRTDPRIEGRDLRQAIISRTHVIPERVVDLREMLGQDRARLERVGLFGVLSVCFLAGTALSMLGLLVYNAASLRGRSLRFAILQALGLTRGGILATVLTEYVGVLFYSVLAGTALGIVGAHLYVPFFQLTEKAGVPVPPYVPLVDNERAVIIAVAMALALVAAEGMVLWRLLRSRLFETLRLGTRE